MLILGACGAGKTSLTQAICRAICGEGHSEHTAEFDCYDRRSRAYVRERVKYVLGNSRIVIPGTWRNGADAVSKPEALRQLVDLCFGMAETVVVDSFRPSARFVDWVQRHPLPALQVVFVYFDISLDTNLARLLSRRRANGKIETELPKKTYDTLLQTRKRAKHVWEYAQQNYVREPKAFVKIPDHFTPAESADLIRDEIRRLWKASSQPAA